MFPLVCVGILSASMTSASTTSVQSVLTAVIVKDGFRLAVTVALQLHELPGDVCVCLCFSVSLCW